MKKQRKKLPVMARRDFTRRLALGTAVGTTGCMGEIGGVDDDDETGSGSTSQPGELLLPPPDAKVQTTACGYCVVGCGYKAYTWPVDSAAGGTAAGDNALGADFPTTANSGRWISPEMYNQVMVDGELHHLVVAPDADTNVVNVGGDHNLGGSLARKLFSPNAPSERLTVPQLRVGSQLFNITWDEATTLMADFSRFVLERSGPLAWGMKTYSYQGYENTYAITKLCFDAIGTPCWAPHDKPREASDTPGLSDAGMNAFGAAYQDFKDAEVLFVSGVSLYDAHPIIFNQWVVSGPKLIVVNPRRDPTADYAMENGGLFLQVRPGTDTVLHNAIAREMLINGWEDTEFISEWVAGAEDLDATREGSVRRERFGVSLEEFRTFIVDNPIHELESAAEITGVAEEDIRAAAEMIALNDQGQRARASFMFEKGNYWSHNYTNTASLASLALISGAGNRSGRVISRAGGHQRGMVRAAPVPEEISPHSIDGEQVGVNLDHWAMEGQLDFCWVVGCTWVGGGTAAAQELHASLNRQARQGPEALPTEAEMFPNGREGGLNTAAVLRSWQARVEAGGLVLAFQDLYAQPMSDLSDLILPAAGWGETTFHRMQGERRLRQYPKIADPPGQARADWEVVADVARRLGYTGFDWADGNELLEEASEASGGANDFRELVAMAREQGRPASDLIRDLGTTGIQCPIRREGASLVGTVRLQEDGFSTPTGKALLVRGEWEVALERQLQAQPGPGELWVINRRAPGTWSAMIEDLHIPYRFSLYPENWVEINASDAAARGIRDGDNIVLETSGVLRGTELDDSAGGGIVRGVAQLTDILQPGVCCMYFNYLGVPNLAANALVQNVEDSVNGLFAFKLGRASLRREI